MQKKIFSKCIFCHKPKGSNNAKNFILERRKTCFAMLNIFPYSNGHVLIAPYRHIGNISQLTHAEFEELFILLCKYENKLQKILKAEGINIGLNIGKAAGAGFAEHIHIHLVPRWSGDANFMIAVNDTKVIPESLVSVFRKLRK